ncbi:hypothetical protein AAG906_013194 [Vitis piasezkii]
MRSFLEKRCQFEKGKNGQLALIGRPCKMCSNQVDFFKGRLLGAQHLMLIALFKKNKKLRGEFPLKPVQIMVLFVTQLLKKLLFRLGQSQQSPQP